MSLGHRLKEILNKKNITQEALAIKLKTTKATVSRWVNNKNLPDIKTLKKIATILNINIIELINYDKPLFNASDINKSIRIPVIENIPAGQSVDLVEDFVGELYIPDTLYEENHFGFIITDNSMYPTLYNGDYVFVVKNQKIKNEDIVIVRLNMDQNAICKRIIHVKEDNYILKSDNPESETIIISKEKYPDFEILGKVIYLGRKLK